MANAGSTFFTAWGTITNLIVSLYPRPSDLLASIWPLSTDCIPDLNISATYALEFIDSANAPAINLLDIGPISGKSKPNCGNP